MPMRPGMEGIVNKVTGYGKRKAVMKRKPGMAVMIAIGAPPKHMGKPMHGEEEAPEQEQEQEYAAKDKATAKDTVECPECGCKIDTKTGEPVEAESEDEGEAEDEEED